MACNSARGFRTAIVVFAGSLLFTPLSLGAQEEQAFRGEVADCTMAGPTAIAEQSSTFELCPTASMQKAAKYILLNREKKTVYRFDNQRKPKAFAAKMWWYSGP